MSGNSGTLAGYWLPATITAEHVEDACAAIGCEITSEATGEEPATMLMHILRVMAQPVVFTGNASDHGIKITTNESGEQRIRQLVFRDEMEAQTARAADQEEIGRLKFIIEIAMRALELQKELFEDRLLSADADFILRVYEAGKTALKWGGRA